MAGFGKSPHPQKYANRPSSTWPDGSFAQFVSIDAPRSIGRSGLIVLKNSA
jgi:hypothetical protein